MPPRGPGKRSAKNRVLAEWRGVDLTGAEKARLDKSRRASEVLPRVLKEMRIDTRRIDAEIVKVWKHAIDPNIAAHAEPTGYHKGTLFVTVEPCVMCAGASFWTQVGRIVYGAPDDKRGYTLTRTDLLHPKTEGSAHDRRTLRNPLWWGWSPTP